MADRLTDSDPDNRVPYWRQYHIEGSTLRNEDDDLTPEHRTDRVHNENLPPEQRVVLAGMTVKEDDHVWLEGLPLHVVGACRGNMMFYGYYYPWFGDMPIAIEGKYITDIARADPADNDTPIRLPEPEPDPNPNPWDPMQEEPPGPEVPPEPEPEPTP